MATVMLTTKTGKHEFQAELALTPEAQAKGLMFRKTMLENHGMLFVFDPPREAAFWMHNTPLPLDILFIAQDCTIHRLVQKTTPLSQTLIPSNGIVAGVLELNAGTAEAIGLFAGDRIETDKLPGCSNIPSARY